MVNATAHTAEQSPLASARHAIASKLAADTAEDWTFMRLDSGIVEAYHAGHAVWAPTVADAVARILGDT
jgi:hypothetical protein